MNSSKDYYSILGVLPTAEDIIIRAAYRALAQRYHPDKFNGKRDEAESRMQELNEAFTVLSDPQQRKQYDEARGGRAGRSTFRDDDGVSPPGNDPLQKDWDLAVKYYPDLATHERRLFALSWKLANTFRACMLESKAFENRARIAEETEAKYFEAYFGTNEEVVRFARTLLEKGQRKAALALNEAVRVLGNKIDPSRVISRIIRDHGLWKYVINREQIEWLLKRIDASPYDTGACRNLIKELGGSSEEIGGFFSEGFRVHFQGETYKFEHSEELRQWVKRHLLSLARAAVQS